MATVPEPLGRVEIVHALTAEFVSPAHAVTVRVRFESGHRLPQLPGKCVNLHGHSWQAHISLGAEQLGDDGLVLDFGALKGAVQEWVDTHLDHGMILGKDDPYATSLRDDGVKVYTVGVDRYSEGLAWPTVEAVAVILGRLTADQISHHPGITLEEVVVAETENNRAAYRPAPAPLPVAVEDGDQLLTAGGRE